MRITALLAIGGVAALAGCASTPRVEAGGDVAPATPTTSRSMPMGSAIDVRLDQTLGASSSHQGDTFSATVINPLLAQDGATVVPAGAVVYGHVTGLNKSSIPGNPSVIRLDFDRLRFNGRDYPFDANVSNVNVENQSSTASSTEKGALTGAAAGAVLGVILGGADLSKLIEGGLLGAAAGTAISLGRDTAHSEIPSGSTMTLRATHDVQLR
ncbi:MAG TPA: hypothetical protein VGM67_01350 [Gemmatimonadaceae bacterium]|jgi:hypothetical protein